MNSDNKFVLLGEDNLHGSAQLTPLDSNNAKVRQPDTKTLLSEKYPSLSSSNLNLKATDIVFVTSKEGNLNEKAQNGNKRGANTTLLSSQKVQQRKVGGNRVSDPRIEADQMIKRISAGEKHVMDGKNSSAE